MVEADLLVDAVVGGSLADVIQNSRPVGDRLRLGPWLERIAQREHVAVGADAGIAEQIPGAADAIAALEDRVALARAFRLQVIARADAGQPGADDQHIDMIGLRGRVHVPPCRHGRTSFRPSTSLLMATLETWMPGTRPGITKSAASFRERSERTPATSATRLRGEAI